MEHVNRKDFVDHPLISNQPSSFFLGAAPPKWKKKLKMDQNHEPFASLVGCLSSEISSFLLINHDELVWEDRALRSDTSGLSRSIQCMWETGKYHQCCSSSRWGRDPADFRTNRIISIGGWWFSPNYVSPSPGIPNTLLIPDTSGTIMDIHDGNTFLNQDDNLYYYYGASYGLCEEPGNAITERILSKNNN